MHDLAQHTAGDESLLLGESSMQITDRLMHISLDDMEAPPSLIVAKKIRSLLGFFNVRHANLEELIPRFQSLRVLSLVNVETPPSSIGRLRHLRYLKLASKGIEYLPDGITRLENLQTLNLNGCYFLKVLPRHFANLANLRHLVVHLENLTDLPSGFGKMTSLHELDRFIVKEGENTGIDSLPALNLRGELKIEFRQWRKTAVLEAQRANLKDNEQLTSLILDLSFLGGGVSLASYELERMIASLQLTLNLSKLVVDGYTGDETPRWWLDGLIKLVSITLVSWDNCRVLPRLRRLPHLKALRLESLNALEYVEDEDDVWVDVAGEKCALNGYFPSLEVLELNELPRLKGWSRPSKFDGKPRQLLFPGLLQMKVTGCTELMSMPLAPKLESLQVRRTNGKLFRWNLTSLDDQEAHLTTLFTSLKRLKIYETNNGLNFLSISNKLCDLETLEINHCHQLWNLVFESPSSVQHLHIYDCRSLRNLSEGKHLPVLETLTISYCRRLEENEEEGNTTNGWQGLRSLRSLELNYMKLEKLPRGILYLTTLEHLSITCLANLTTLPEEIDNLSLLFELRVIYCPRLTSLPTSLKGLKSLQKLYIRGCPDLGRRYQKNTGKDCHLIQHIPHADISSGSELSFHDLGLNQSPLRTFDT